MGRSEKGGRGGGEGIVTPQQKLFEDACSALHGKVAPDIVIAIRRKGRDAIRAARTKQKTKDAATARRYAEHKKMKGRTERYHAASQIANAIEVQEE